MSARVRGLFQKTSNMFLLCLLKSLYKTIKGVWFTIFKKIEQFTDFVMFQTLFLHTNR